jgi:hypothetical protein
LQSAIGLQLDIVMRGLVPRIHACRAAAEDVDGRPKAGHDDNPVGAPEQFPLSSVLKT